MGPLEPFRVLRDKSRKHSTSPSTNCNTMAAGNRKERRAKDASSAASGSRHPLQPTTEIDEDSIHNILKHPDYSGGPKGKTLFELADERQRELNKGKPGRRSDGTVDDDVAIGPLGDAILYGISMMALHLTLDVIVYSQYREAILWDEIFKRAARAAPVFVLLVYLTHVQLALRFPIARNIAFLAGSVAAGCYLVYSANNYGYFYVMKSAPSVGALWVWSVIEMSLPFAAANALAVIAYIWWNGFEFF
jgi:hypothetical protein